MSRHTHSPVSLARILLILAILSLMVVSPALAQEAPTSEEDAAPVPRDVNAFLAPDVVGNNPNLQPGCGIKVVLVLDASGSINTTEQGQVRTASNAFLGALQNTGSQVAIVEFATLGDVPVGYTPVTTASINGTGVFANYLSATNVTGPQYYDGRDSVDNGGTAWTNWDYAFYRVNGLPTAPDLVVFMTDGDPTAYGGHGGVSLQTNTNGNAATLNAAEASANLTKLASGAGGPWGTNAGNQGLGSHNFGVGVGTGVNLTNMYRVLDDGGAGGNIAFSAGPPSNFPVADYVVTTNFTDLEAALRSIAEELCSSSLTITKLVDMGGGAGYVPQSGWTFTSNLTPSAGTWEWKSPCVGGSGSCAGATGANGQVFFQWLLNNTSATTTSIQIVETQQSGYEFVDVTCTVGGVSQSVTQAETFTVSGIARTAAASCTVRNCLIPTGVTLGDFSAACVGETPLISWETVSELNNQGFNLYRGVDSANPDTQLNATMIPSQGPGSAQGFTYIWTDDTAAPDTEYFYWVEDVSFSGATSMHGPITAMCSAPTAVTLSGLDASAPVNTAISGWLVALLLGAMLAGFVAVRRMRTN